MKENSGTPFNKVIIKTFFFLILYVSFMMYIIKKRRSKEKRYKNYEKLYKKLIYLKFWDFEHNSIEIKAILHMFF